MPPSQKGKASLRPLILMPSDLHHGYTGQFGDGLSANRVAASAQLNDRGLVIQPPGAAEVVWPYADLRASDPIRKSSIDAVITSRAGGRASLFVDDTLLLAMLTKRAPQIRLRAERWRTARPGLAVGTLAALGYGAIWFFNVSPAKAIASTMPEKARIVLGNSVIRSMPEQRRCTGTEGRVALSKLVRRLMPNGPITADNITVLDWPLLNAFAVPGNRIVLTRGIIAQSLSPDEIAAVIGHEAGHTIELHPEAGLVRSVGFWALVQMLFTGTPGAIGNIGTVLAQLGYTRVAEREADGHALRLMREAGISPKAMADFFRRMETQRPSGAPRTPGASNDIFSSHPSTPERIALIESQPTYPSTAALADEDWKALKTICQNKEGGSVPLTPSAGNQPPRLPTPPPTPPPPQQKAATVNETPVNPATAAATPDAKIEIATRRIAADKADAEAFVMRGQAYVTKLNYTAAIEDFTQAITLKPGNTAALFARAMAYAQLKQLDPAIADYSEVIRLQPQSHAAYNNRANLYRAQKKLDASLRDYSAAIALNSKYTVALSNRALVYRERKEYESAITDFTAAIATNTSYAIAYVRRGETYELMSLRDKAIADFRAVLKLPEPAGAPSEPHKTARARLQALGVPP